MGNQRVVVTGFGVVTRFGAGTKNVMEGIYQKKRAADDSARFSRFNNGGKSSMEAVFPTYRSFAEYCTRRALHMAMLRPGKDRYWLRNAAVAMGNREEIPLLPDTDARRNATSFAVHQASEAKQTLCIQDRNPAQHAEFIADYIGSNMGRIAFTNADVASSNAIGYGYDQIRKGVTDCAVVGGIHVSPDLCDERSDTLIGNGAAVLVLESWSRAQRRNIKPLAEIGGWGYGSDAFDQMQPDLEGWGLERAMRMAMHRAGLTSDEIDYILTDEVGMMLSDGSETKAVWRVFGSSVNNLRIGSTKLLTGHMLEATGAVEAVISILSLISGQAPAAVRDWRHGERGAKKPDLHAVMNNASSYNGNHCSLIFKKIPGT